MSTNQKVLVGVAVVALLSGGAAWAAIEASSSRSSHVSSVGPDRRYPRLPAQLGPGQRFGGPGRLRPGGLQPGGLGPDRGRFGPGRLGAGGFLCRLAHGEAVLVDGGTTHDVRFDHGTVDSVSSDSVTVQEADGSSVTIPVDGGTVVRRDGQQASLSDLKAGDVVFAIREGTGAARFLRALDSGLLRCAPGPGPGVGPGAGVSPSPPSA